MFANRMFGPKVTELIISAVFFIWMGSGILCLKYNPDLFTVVFSLHILCAGLYWLVSAVISAVKSDRKQKTNKYGGAIK